MQYAAPKGTYDILPPGPNRSAIEDSSRWQWIEGIFRELCALYGYREIRTPIFEATDLFHRAVGDGTDIVTKETYDFTTRGGDALTLRPEGTAGTLRAFVTNRLYFERPVTKLFYIGPNFRYEAPQKGRYRQHHQAGVEALGSDDPAIDAEVIALAVAFYARLGIGGLRVKINSVGTVASRTRYVDALRDWARPLLPQMSAENRRRFEQNALRMLDSKEEEDIALLGSAPSLLDFLDDDDRTGFDQLRRHLDSLGIAYEIDPRLVRGFDYYTRTAFEVQSDALGDKALGGGGRYNRLVEEVGGPATPGIGFGLGLERALLALETAGAAPPSPVGPVAFFCPLGEAARAFCVRQLAILRAAGIAADMDYTARRLKIMFEQADTLGAKYAVIVGDDEIARGEVQLRDMTTKEARQIAVNELPTALRG